MNVAEPQSAVQSPQQIAAQSGSSFLIGFRCLPAERRAAMTTVYAFCRVADDAVDDATTPEEGAAHLAFWRTELGLVTGGAPTTPVGRELQQVVQKFGGGIEPYRELLDGMEMDLHHEGYRDLEALELYCHRVASAPGLACLPVLGATSDGAREFSQWLGRALQLTNILRDLRSDMEEGRIYAPADWLDASGVQAEWLGGTGPSEVYASDGPVARLTQRIAVAARERFARTESVLAQLSPQERKNLVPARIMGAVYRSLLSRLEQRGGDLRGPRVRVSKLRRLSIALAMMVGLRG